MPVQNKQRRAATAYPHRRANEALWLKPVWRAARPRPYDAEALGRFVTAICERMRGA